MPNGVTPAEELVLVEAGLDQTCIVQENKGMAAGGLIPGTMVTDGKATKEGKEDKMIVDGPCPDTGLLRLDNLDLWIAYLSNSPNFLAFTGFRENINSSA